MSGTWYAAFGLLALLSVANAAVLIAVMRQVGVLHLRLRPTGPGTHEGPQIGQELPVLPMERISGDPADRLFAKPITVLVYVTPGCSVCAALRDIVRTYLGDGIAYVQAAFATDAPPEAARIYAEEHPLPAPLFQNDTFARTYSLPGSPYVIALAQPKDGNAIVLRAGVVNTLEQFEDLVGGAEVQLASLESARREAERSTLTVVGSGAAAAAERGPDGDGGMHDGR